jgi:hypothetical protein
MNDYPELIAQEHTFINLYPNHPTLQLARQSYVNKRFSHQFFTWWSDNEQIVGFTLNQKKTKVIRIFYNRSDLINGDHRSESVFFQKVKCGVPGPYLHK